MGKMDGRVALVTGAARGQGEAIARLFVDEGAKVLVTDVLDKQGQETAADIGENAIWCRLDVSSAAQWTAAVDTAVTTFGKLDVLVNNAAIFPAGSIETMSEDQYMQVVRINQLGPWLGMKAVLGPMKAAGGGSIINTASVAGLIGMSGLSAYVASKHALRGMTKTAAAEFGAYRIRVNSIFPGTIMGEHIRAAGVDLVALDALFEDQPVGRIGQPIDIARIALFLASEDSSYCTGTEVLADGGVLASPWQIKRPAKTEG